MCRLLGWAAGQPTSLADLLGADLPTFTALSRRHADGWGSAYATGDGLRLEREAGAAHASPAYARDAHDQQTAAGLVHLRWATEGMPVRVQNSHPFVHRDPGLGDWAFAHNGAVPVSSAEPLVDADLLASTGGDTDSERYFLALVSAARRTGSVLPALREVTSALSGYSSLNSLLLTPEALYATCLHDPARLPPDEEPDYFHLQHRRLPGAVVVASTGLHPQDSEQVANGTVLVVDRATLDMRVEPLVRP